MSNSRYKIKPSLLSHKLLHTTIAPVTIESCNHTAWLRVVQNSTTEKLILEETGQLGRLVRGLLDPDHQTP
jgi:hypothetical protein